MDAQTAATGGAGSDTTDALYDPFSKRVMGDPYPDLAQLRKHCPVHHHSQSGLYTVTRWEDVTSLASTADVYISGKGIGFEDVLPDLRVLAQSDEPDHSLQRRVVSKYYAPKRLEAIEGRVTKICNELIDGFIDRGSCEFADEFAYPFPIRVVAELLGWDPTDQEVQDLKDWQLGVLRMLAGGEEEQGAGYAALGNFASYVFERVQARKEVIERGDDVPDDPVTAVLTAEDGGKAYGELEVLAFIQQLLNHETTAAMFLHGIHLLLSHPEELEKLRCDPTLIDSAVEEILRFRAPVTGLCRVATRETTLHGVVIPEGSRIRLMWASANHDPDHWDAPEHFRVDRDLNEVRRHLTFGHGIHSCLGAQLVRMEGRIGFLALLDRLPDLRLDPNRPPVAEDAFWVIHTWRSMPLRWDPSAALTP